jgi:glycosyltransferase involved in cell wall biosynthesis
VTGEVQPPLLSIVIPAYRGRFLAEALESVARAADADTEVVVGDDASPDDIRGIAEPYQSRLNLRYHRFDTNLGGRSLTRQWDRCVALSRGQWVLLLGDDDLIDPHYVRAFRETLAATDGRFDVYRFDTRWIDANGAVIRSGDSHPDVQRWDEYLLARFRSQSYTFTCDNVFARSAYDRAGGFVDFPLAWCADDASWIAFGARTGFKKVHGALASWRLSGDNISSNNTNLLRCKLLAMSKFLAWLARNRRWLHPSDTVRSRDIQSAGVAWYFDRYWAAPQTMSYTDLPMIALRLGLFSPATALRCVLRLVRQELALRLMVRDPS